MGALAGSNRSRIFALALFGALALLGGLSFATPAHAQDDIAQPAEPVEGTGEEGGAALGEQPKLIEHIVKSAGPIFGPLLLLISIMMVTIIVLLAMDLRLATSIPPYFVEEFTDTVNKRQFKNAFELARNENSFLGRVITAGMGRLQYGIEDAREAAMNMVDSIRASKDQLIAYLATIGTLGPMIGLVGTVYGMIIAFMELSRPGATPRPDKLADGISHALVVTLLGIGLSVPAIFTHAFFRNRLIRISMDTANIADDLLTQMYHNSRKPGPAPGPGGAPGQNAAMPAKQPTI